MSAQSSGFGIVHNMAAGRFEATVEGELSHVDYRRVGDTLHIMHTEVPPALAGRGIAGTLVQATLDFAEANRLKVTPHCAYTRAYIRRHPETQSLLSAGARV
jgi:predicted GNAT family acetyltransferase